MSQATRIELEEAMRNLMAAEEHLLDVIRQKPSPELRRLADDTRNIRQSMALTNIPFRAELPVDPSAVGALEKMLKDIDDLITRINRYAVEMRQELQVSCPVCREDVGVERVVEELKKISSGPRPDTAMGPAEKLSMLSKCLGVEPPNLVIVSPGGEMDEETRRLVDSGVRGWYNHETRTIFLVDGRYDDEVIAHEFYHHYSTVNGGLRGELPAIVFTKGYREGLLDAVCPTMEVSTYVGEGRGRLVESDAGLFEALSAMLVVCVLALSVSR